MFQVLPSKSHYPYPIAKEWSATAPLVTKNLISYLSFYQLKFSSRNSKQRLSNIHIHKYFVLSFMILYHFFLYWINGEKINLSSLMTLIYANIVFISDSLDSNCIWNASSHTWDCYLCQKQYSCKSNVYRHIEMHHIPNQEYRRDKA